MGWFKRRAVHSMHHAPPASEFKRVFGFDDAGSGLLVIREQPSTTFLSLRKLTQPMGESVLMIRPVVHAYFALDLAIEPTNQGLSGTAPLVFDPIIPPSPFLGVFNLMLIKWEFHLPGNPLTSRINE